MRSMIYFVVRLLKSIMLNAMHNAAQAYEAKKKEKSMDAKGCQRKCMET